MSVSSLRSGRVGFPAPCTPTPTPHFLGSFLLGVLVDKGFVLGSVADLPILFLPKDIAFEQRVLTTI